MNTNWTVIRFSVWVKPAITKVQGVIKDVYSLHVYLDYNLESEVLECFD